MVSNTINYLIQNQNHKKYYRWRYIFTQLPTNAILKPDWSKARTTHDFVELLERRVYYEDKVCDRQANLICR